MNNIIEKIDSIIEESFKINYSKNEAIFLLGPPNSGKTTYINKHIDKNKYIIVDAAEYYKKLTGSYLGFNEEFIEELNYIGFTIMQKILKNKYSFVMEFQLDNYKEIIKINKKLKKLSYNVKGIHLDCREEDSIKRNENKTNISSYFTENFHIAWLTTEG